MANASEMLGSSRAATAADRLAGADKKSPREMYLDYVVEQQSNGEPAMEFKEWYEKHQKENT